MYTDLSYSILQPPITLVSLYNDLVKPLLTHHCVDALFNVRDDPSSMILIHGTNSPRVTQICNCRWGMTILT
jgi:hypothetical protein